MNALGTELRRRIKKNIAPIGNAGEFAYSSPTALIVPESISEREMSAEFVIVSGTEDRDNDIIEPAGCEEYLDEYRRNPVVLLEHDCLKPIGLSTDKSGQFHFRILADKIIAKCFFHCLPLNGENLSEEVFRLVTKGVFRGASIGFLPIRGRKRGYGKDDGYTYTAWRPTEWSLTTQPVHQDTLRCSLAGIRCKSLRHTLESLVVKSAPVIVGGFDSKIADGVGTQGQRSMKPKTAAIEFDKSVFADESACVAWLNAHGNDSSACMPLASSYIFTQREGKPNAGKKSLGKGVTALLTKAFGKKDEEEGDDKIDGKEEKADDMEDDKIEKSDDETDEDAIDDESDDLEDGDAEDADANDESETPEEDEAAPEDETPVDPEALKAEAQDLANVVTHFKTLLAAIPEMSQRSSKMGDQYGKLATDAQALIDDLSAAFGEHFSDVALDAMASKAADEPQAPVEPTPDAAAEEREIAKTLKAAMKSMESANKTAKSLPKLYQQTA